MTEQKKDYNKAGTRRSREQWIVRIVAALLVFAVEVLWMTSSNGPLREDVSNYLTGEGSYGVAFEADSVGYTQSFVPQHGELTGISILVNAKEHAEAEGSVELAVIDASGQVLAQKMVAAEELAWGKYTDVSLGLDVKKGKTYSLIVASHLENVEQPELYVCSTEYELKENKTLRGTENLAGAQLVTRYSYSNALRGETVAKMLLLAALTALGIAVGLPKDNRVRAVVGVVLLAAGPYVLGQRLELLMPTHVLLPHAMKWNLGIMYLFELIVLLCTCSMRVAVVFCNVALTVLYCANYFVQAFRGTYLKLNELTAVGTAAEVVGKYQFDFTADMAIAWCIMGVLVAWGMNLGLKELPYIRRLATKLAVRCAAFVVGAGITGFAGHYLIDTELLLEHGFEYYSGMNSEYTYLFDGYLVGSMLDIKYSKITEPEGYSVTAVENVLEKYRESSKADVETQELPHIILIMNESWSDLRVNGNLEISRENFSFTNSLKENTIKGYTNVSVLGGGTANTEFEVFTGCSMGFLPDSYYAYQQAVMGPMDSMVSNLKNQGYSTYAMHPEKPTNWRRNLVYDYLGFDTRLFKEDFAGAEEIHSGVSDAETFDKIIELYEARQVDEKMLIFDLTMQNHGYYQESNVDRTVEALNVDSDEADIYLSLVYETDRAFEELIGYFEAQDEKVIVCMFGDHQPKFESEAFYEDIYKQTAGLTEEEKALNLHKTPFVIWANYDIEEAEALDISTNYLGVLLQQTAGVELTGFASYLAELQESYPIITVNGYVDAEGNYRNWSGAGNEFLEYRMLQYNYLFDKNIVEWGFGTDS